MKACCSVIMDFKQIIDFSRTHQRSKWFNVTFALLLGATIVTKAQYYGILKEKDVNTKSYNEYPNTALTGVNIIREIKATEYRDCISVCESEEATCKSMNVVTVTKDDITCALFDTDTGAFETRSNTLFISKHEPKCSGYCEELSYLDLCGKCKCKDKCNSLYSHYCDCTEGLREQKTCEAVKDAGFLIPALYNIKFDTGEGFKGFCETQSDGTVWMTMMRRQVLNDEFSPTKRTMDDYKNGFGKPHGEVYWLGLDRIKTFTQSNNTILRVVVTTYDGKHYFGEYENFTLDDQYNYVYTFYRTDCCIENGFAEDSQPFSLCDDKNRFWFDQCIGTKGYPTETEKIRWGRTILREFRGITFLLRHGSLPPVKEKSKRLKAGCTFHNGVGSGITTMIKVPVKLDVNGNADENLCIDACAEKKLLDNEINGVYFQNVVLESPCICVKGMKERKKPDIGYSSCLLGQQNGCTLYKKTAEKAGSSGSVPQGVLSSINDCVSVCSKNGYEGTVLVKKQGGVPCWCYLNMKGFQYHSTAMACVFGFNGCRVYTGKGIGKELKMVGSKYNGWCRSTCLARQKKGETIDGVIYMKQSDDCWCAKGMVGVESYYKSCFLRNESQSLQETPKTACEGQWININCNSSPIKILSATYGRQSTTICTNNAASALKNTSCSSPPALTLKFVEDQCEGKQSCTLQANGANFGGDPCRGTYKYLSIGYECKSAINIKKTGKCTSITEKECKDYSTTNNKAFATFSSNDYPPGCYYKVDEDINFNTFSTSPKPCTNVRNCLCIGDPVLPTGGFSIEQTLSIGTVAHMGHEFCISFDFYIAELTGSTKHNVFCIHDANNDEFIHVKTAPILKEIAIWTRDRIGGQTYRQSVTTKTWYNVKIYRYQKNNEGDYKLQITIDGVHVHSRDNNYNMGEEIGLAKVYLQGTTTHNKVQKGVVQNVYINGEYFDPDSSSVSTV